MKRLIGVLAATAAAGATILLAGPAQADGNYVMVQGSQYNDPSGCFVQEDTAIPLAISNQSDQTVYVYKSTTCGQGAPIAEIAPGSAGTIPAGSLSEGPSN